MNAEFATLAALEPLMDKCVHCGFCLATCPSYILLGQEMASPRGRIYLMRAGIESRVTIGPAFVGHFDTCLGCMLIRHAVRSLHTGVARQPSRSTLCGPKLAPRSWMIANGWGHGSSRRPD